MTKQHRPLAAGDIAGRGSGTAAGLVKTNGASGVHQMIRPTAEETHGSFQHEVVAEYGSLIGLTRREQEVFSNTVRGRTNKEIATDLRLSHDTVRAHWANICRKTGLATQKLVLAQFMHWLLARVTTSHDSAAPG